MWGGDVLEGSSLEIITIRKPYLFEFIKAGGLPNTTSSFKADKSICLIPESQ